MYRAMRPNLIKLKYRPNPDLSIVLNEASKLNTYLRPIVDNNFLCEEFFVVYLNAAFNPLGAMKVNIGGLTSVMVDIGIIVRTALLSRSRCIVVAHTHPSGSLVCSPLDIKLTKDLKAALSIFEISLVDHLLLTYNNHASYVEKHSF